MKILLGLVVALLIGWIWHGPLGHGERLVSALEAEARAATAKELPGISVRLSRDPLSREATLSGPADEVQREGMGSLPGLTDIVGGIEGISAVRWADEPERRRFALPLLAELLILAAFAYGIGLGLAWLLWGRPRRQSFLD